MNSYGPTDTIDIMLDLETFGTSSNSVILAIGAAAATPQGEVEPFYVNVQASSCTAVGLEMDADTVMWWMGQGEEARSMLIDPEPMILPAALAKFHHWITTSILGYSTVHVWGNAASFDNVILANAYKECGMLVPWNFRSNMCYRTLKNLYPEIPLVREGIQHNAVDDATSQLVHLVAILAEMRRKGVKV